MAEELLTVVALVLFALVAFFAMRFQQAKLDDQTDRSVVYCSQLQGMICVDPGTVTASLLRQSGNVYRDLGEFASARDALDEVIRSFNRAKIESVTVHENTGRALEVWRAFYNHRGKSEGKKLGGAIIRKV